MFRIFLFSCWTIMKNKCVHITCAHHFFCTCPLWCLFLILSPIFLSKLLFSYFAKATRIAKGVSENNESRRRSYECVLIIIIVLFFLTQAFFLHLFFYAFFLLYYSCCRHRSPFCLSLPLPLSLCLSFFSVFSIRLAHTSVKENSDVVVFVVPSFDGFFLVYMFTNIYVKKNHARTGNIEVKCVIALFHS